MGYLLYALSTLLAFYTLYLYAFHAYKRVFDKKTYEKVWVRQTSENILYVLLVIVALIPIINIISSAVFLLVPVFDNDEDFKIDSWLYRKPGEKEEEEKKDE